MPWHFPSAIIREGLAVDGTQEVLKHAGDGVYYYYYYCYKWQLSCHLVAVILTLVQTKQIRINIYK
jgi:hypothetical protein